MQIVTKWQKLFLMFFRFKRKKYSCVRNAKNVIIDINIYDVIPLNDKLLMIGDNTLRQYSYKDYGLEEISSYTLK